MDFNLKKEKKEESLAKKISREDVNSTLKEMGISQNLNNLKFVLEFENETNCNKAYTYIYEWNKLTKTNAGTISMKLHRHFT